jgi:hypothetical protein
MIYSLISNKNYGQWWRFLTAEAAILEFAVGLEAVVYIGTQSPKSQAVYDPCTPSGGGSPHFNSFHQRFKQLRQWWRLDYDAAT